MRVLVVGAGGREHALAWKLKQSPRLTALFVAPGNGGTERLATNLACDIADNAAVVALAKARAIDFVVVGPDAQVVQGLGDALRAAGILCFCPSAAAGQLEGSKSFTKTLCDEMGIPTARYKSFDSELPALDYVGAHRLPVVVKADGLALGKGVTVAGSRAEAEDAIRACFAGAFGPAGGRVVIEEYLDGEEASFFVLCDGDTILPLATAQDHKRAFDGDMGPNTGGMGAYSPAPALTPALVARVLDEIIVPTVRGMAARGTPYQGVLYAGLMLTADGPMLIEFNARFGDPETQVMLPRLKSDLLELLVATASGSLAGCTAAWREETALTVVMATRGYPSSYETGSEIFGAEGLEADDLTIFHAGTKRVGGRLLANGGRVLNVTALGADVAAAKQRADAAALSVDWPQGFYRRDIGWRSIIHARNLRLDD